MTVSRRLQLTQALNLKCWKLHHCKKKKTHNHLALLLGHGDVEWHNEGGNSSCNLATYSGSNLEAHMLHPLPLFLFFFVLHPFDSSSMLYCSQPESGA